MVITGATLADYHAGSGDLRHLAILRGEAIARQVSRWHRDVVDLCERRATAPSAAIAEALAARGLVHLPRHSTAGVGDHAAVIVDLCD